MTKEEHDREYRVIDQMISMHAVIAQAKKSQAEHDEGKSCSVVQTCFTRQCVPQAICVFVVLDLNSAGQHRVGRSEHRPQEHRCAHGERKREDTQRGHTGNRDNHGYRRQWKRRP